MRDPYIDNASPRLRFLCDRLDCFEIFLSRVFLFPSFQQASYIGVNLRSPQPLLDGAPWIEQGIRDYPGEWYHATPSIFPGIKG